MMQTEIQVVVLQATDAPTLSEKIEEQVIRPEVVSVDPFAPWYDGTWQNVILVLTVDMDAMDEKRVRSWR